jgi:hypothetical protein
VVIGVLFLVKFATGFWLSRAGKPYNVFLLTAHKLISLLIVLLIALAVRHLRQGIGLGAVEVVAIVVTGLLFLLSIASGGLLSTDKPAHVAIPIAHKVLPFLSVASTAAMVYLLWNKP